MHLLGGLHNCALTTSRPGEALLPPESRVAAALSGNPESASLSRIRLRGDFASSRKGLQDPASFNCCGFERCTKGLVRSLPCPGKSSGSVGGG